FSGESAKRPSSRACKFEVTKLMHKVRIVNWRYLGIATSATRTTQSRTVRWIVVVLRASCVDLDQTRHRPKGRRGLCLNGNVRFVPLADIQRGPIDVRFTPESGHWLSASGCPLCAKSRHSWPYSITS